jgi:hypothetical protein
MYINASNEMKIKKERERKIEKKLEISLTRR